MAVSRTRARPDPRQLAVQAASALDAAGVAAGGRLCVALSGGVDSVVALHVLAGLRESRGFELSAAHVNHGLQAGADAWQTFCEACCASMDVTCTSLRVIVDKDHPDGIEGAAREARHAALSGLRADWLVFGHHLDDQAETLLFRLMRGAGVRGAAAMALFEPGAPGRLRPLLDVRRSAILAYAAGHGLQWVEDPSNLDRRHARNRLRHDVLPTLEAFSPAAVHMLGRSALNFREADGLLDELADQDAARCRDGDGFVLAGLRALSDARLRNLLRWLIRQGGAEVPARARLSEAVRQLSSSEAVSLHLPLGQIACCVHRGRVWIEPLPGPMPEPVQWRGEDALDWGGGRVLFERADGNGLSRDLLADAELVFAPRRAGLRMATAPGRPRHSFKNLCQEAGLPPWWRDRLPVLYADGEPVWIAGIGISPLARCAARGGGVMPRWQRGGWKGSASS